MANLEVLALDTAVPQIRAPGAGDGYSVPRDMTFASGTVLSAPTVDATNVEVTNIKAKDGTAAASIADSTGVVSITANPILSGGTANGVLYLDGSKVATSGSALTFDGTTFGVTSTWGSNSQLFTNATASNLSGITARYNGANKGYLYFDNSTSLYNLYGEAGISLAFTANAAEGMRLTSTGLGIGTTSPDERLTVTATNPTDGRVASLRNNATSSLTGTKLWFNQATVDNWNIGQPAGVSAFVFCNSTGSANERMRLDSSGNLGLGVTPSAWGSGRRVLQIGTSPYIMGSGTSLEFLANAYYNGTNWIYNSNGAAAEFALNAGAFYWYSASSGTAGNTATFTNTMVLDASGNLGIGTTSLLSFANYTTLRVGGSSTTIGLISAYDGTTDMRMSTANNGIGYVGTNTNHPVTFITNATERARITAGGDLLVGTTSSGGKLTVEQSGANANGAFITNQTYDYQTLGLHNTATANDNLWVVFGTEAAFTFRGSIDYNRAGGQVRYNTTSDYRAKEVYGPVEDSGKQIDALKIYRGKMLGATQERPMMIAHEAQEVVPYAVGGEKDAVNENGTPKYQTMDHQILVPLLIAEIQSLRARVAALEA